MNSLSADTQRAIAVAITGAAIVIALWMLVIAPKKDDSTAAGERADRQEQRLGAAQAKVTANASAKAEFPALKKELQRLDVAVPVRGDIADMLRQLQAEARRRGADLRVVSLKQGGAAAADPAAAAPATAGAQPGNNGLSTLPFDMQFTGRYQDLVHLLRTVRRAVSEKDGKVTAKRRLLTIDGLSFERPVEESALTKATLNATAYIAAPLGAKPAAATAGVPATGPTATSPPEKARAAAVNAENKSAEVKP